MGTMMVDGLASLLLDGCTVSKAQLHDESLACQADGIKVLFESFDTRNGSRISKTAILSSATTVQEIKLSGRHQGWFKSGDKLVRNFILMPLRLRSACYESRLRLEATKSKNTESHRMNPFAASWNDVAFQPAT